MLESTASEISCTHNPGLSNNAHKILIRVGSPESVSSVALSLICFVNRYCFIVFILWFPPLIGWLKAGEWSYPLHVQGSLPQFGQGSLRIYYILIIIYIIFKPSFEYYHNVCFNESQVNVDNLNKVYLSTIITNKHLICIIPLVGKSGIVKI